MRKYIVILALSVLILPLKAAATWKTTRLTFNSSESRYPAIVLDSNNYIHMAWEDWSPGNAEIFYKKSTDGGVTWTTKRLTYNSGYSWNPDIAVGPNNHIHVVWRDRTSANWEICYKRSTDGGATWITKRLSFNTGDSVFPIIAVDSKNYIHVVWYDNSPGNWDLYYKRSEDGGATWTTKRLTYNPDGSYKPAIAIDSNDHIHLVWYDETPGNSEIFYKKSTNGGTTWTTKRLTYNFGYSEDPAIAVDSNNHIHLVWYEDTPGNWEIYYKKSTDGGTTWTTRRLTYNPDGSYKPAIAVDSNNHPHVVWFDHTPGNYEIYYKNSLDGGATWTTERLTYNSGMSEDPDVSTDSDNHVYIVWYDNNPGNSEIYLKKN